MEQTCTDKSCILKIKCHLLVAIKVSQLQHSTILANNNFTKQRNQVGKHLTLSKSALEKVATVAIPNASNSTASASHLGSTASQGIVIAHPATTMCKMKESVQGQFRLL
jgi:hypothetical protein